MGITLSCKKTGRSIDLGGGFLRLRRKVAELYGGPFVAVYNEICSYDPLFCTDESAAAFDDRVSAKIERILNARQADIKIVDFLLQSDIEGRIRYGACKNILKAIGDYDDNLLYGYVGRPDCAKFADFRKILEDCVATKSDMVWR